MERNVSYRPKRSSRNDCDEEVRTLFEKKFHFQPPEEGAWQLPEASKLFVEPPWSVKSLQVEKSRLNFHKSQLNDLRIEEWSQHTRRRNPAGEVSWTLRRAVDPEFLTQAWSKFYECVCTYDVVPTESRDGKQLVSLHLCEAPGAFVTALNHYLCLHHPDMQWNWTASTLNPYYEGNSPSNMISDDRFMLHTLDHWSFGTDHTGDLLVWQNAASIILQATSHGEVMLVTADGSIDCMERPDAQEEVTSQLHYCELVTALHALAPGGTFICKLFTIFEHSTVNLLYLVSCLFREVHIYKPVTSKCGNSEVYAVCLHYAGITTIKPYLNLLQDGYGTKLYHEKALFPVASVPQSFIDQVLNCAQFFCSMQCNVINANLEAYLQRNFNCPQVKVLRTLVSAKFLDLYQLRAIPREKEILRGLMHERQEVNTNPRYQRGSYTQRSNFEHLSAAEKFSSLEREVDCNCEQAWMKLRDGVITWQCYYDPLYKIQLQFVHGKRLNKLRSSKFVFTPVFNQYLKLIREGPLEPTESYVLSAQEISDKYGEDTSAWKVVDFPFVNVVDYECYNRTCLQLIVDAVADLHEGETIFLSNWDILSHLSVGILFIMCTTCFRSVGFTDGCGLVLRDFAAGSDISVLREILTECERCERECISLLRVLPVTTTNVGDLFNTVICYNNLVYMKKSVHLLSNFRDRVMRGKQ